MAVKYKDSASVSFWNSTERHMPFQLLQGFKRP